MKFNKQQLIITIMLVIVTFLCVGIAFSQRFKSINPKGGESTKVEAPQSDDMAKLMVLTRLSEMGIKKYESLEPAAQTQYKVMVKDDIAVEMVYAYVLVDGALDIYKPDKDANVSIEDIKKIDIKAFEKNISKKDKKAILEIIRNNIDPVSFIEITSDDFCKTSLERNLVYYLSGDDYNTAIEIYDKYYNKLK